MTDYAVCIFWRQKWTPFRWLNPTKLSLLGCGQLSITSKLPEVRGQQVPSGSSLARPPATKAHRPLSIGCLPLVIVSILSVEILRCLGICCGRNQVVRCLILPASCSDTTELIATAQHQPVPVAGWRASGKRQDCPRSYPAIHAGNSNPQARISQAFGILPPDARVQGRCSGSDRPSWFITGPISIWWIQLRLQLSGNGLASQRSILEEKDT